MSNLVLVTGGAGYVGSMTVQQLLAGGHQVRSVDALLHGRAAVSTGLNGRSGLEFVQADVRDRAAMAEALAGVDAVVHLAAIVGDPACSREPHLAREVNLDATRQLLELAQEQGVRTFIFASTCSNYGKLEGAEYADEDFDLRPVSLYAETKVAAELAVIAAGSDDFRTVCLRLATVYGVSPRMRFDLTVNEFTRDVVLARELVVYGEQFWRPYVHVDDAARAIVLALAQPPAGEVFNVGSTDENYRKLDIVELLKERVPTAQISFVQKDEDPRDCRVSFEKVKERLGLVPDRTVPFGIDEIMALLASGLLADPYARAYQN